MKKERFKKTKSIEKLNKMAISVKKPDLSHLIWDEEWKKFLSDKGEVKTLKPVGNPQLFLSNNDWFDSGYKKGKWFEGYEKEKKLYERAEELDANAFSVFCLNGNHRVRGYGHGQFLYAANFYKVIYKKN